MTHPRIWRLYAEVEDAVAAEFEQHIEGLGPPTASQTLAINICRARARAFRRIADREEKQDGPWLVTEEEMPDGE